MSSRILVEVENMVVHYLRQAAELVASSLTIVSIVGLLIWVNPVVAIISLLVLGGSYLLFYSITRHILQQLGSLRAEYNLQRFRFANEALSGIKDIKLLGHEGSYTKRFALPSMQMAQAQTNIFVISQVPQFVLQAVALGGVILLCILHIDNESIVSGTAMASLLPTLGLFAFAGQRLLPELSKIYVALAEMRASAASVDVVYADSCLLQNQRSFPKVDSLVLGLKDQLRLENISFNYSGTQHAGLRRISLSIKVGEKIGIVGGTGAGKTTLADIILGLLEPNQGKLIVDETEITAENVRSWMRCVG
jgi:ABC-type multidrug transport system fused ATPase/permease subunit